MAKKFLLTALLSGSMIMGHAQEDSLMALLNSSAPAKNERITSTFNTTRINNGASIETLGAGILDFRISHRFGSLSDGLENAFGLDDAVTRIGFDYGITNWLMVGIGHNTFLKENDGFLKVRLLSQKQKGMPVTLSYYGAMSVMGKPSILPPGEWYFTNQLFFTNQLLLARKINDKVSLQLSPTMLHFNLVDSSKWSNNIFALGIGGRVKLTKRISLTGEYFYRVNNTDMLVGSTPTHNALSIGFDIETGGHTFQLLFSNSRGITDRTFIGQTTDSWGDGGIHFGFNISRVFTIVKPKEYQDGKKW
jgi:opacity protein-like surface antigen